MAPRDRWALGLQCVQRFVGIGVRVRGLPGPCDPILAMIVSQKNTSE
jgi:hypothetical protein